MWLWRWVEGVLGMSGDQQEVFLERIMSVLSWMNRSEPWRACAKHGGKKAWSASSGMAGTEVVKGTAVGIDRGYFLKSLVKHDKKLGFYWRKRRTTKGFKMGNVNILERPLVHAKNIIGWIAKEFQEVSVTPTLMIPKQIAIRAFRQSHRHTHTHPAQFLSFIWIGYIWFCCKSFQIQNLMTVFPVNMKNIFS